MKEREKREKKTQNNRKQNETKQKKRGNVGEILASAKSGGGVISTHKSNTIALASKPEEQQLLNPSNFHVFYSSLLYLSLSCNSNGVFLLGFHMTSEILPI